MVPARSTAGDTTTADTEGNEEMQVTERERDFLFFIFGMSCGGVVLHLAQAIFSQKTSCQPSAVGRFRTQARRPMPTAC
jgi:hypothetical protein